MLNVKRLRKETKTLPKQANKNLCLSEKHKPYFERDATQLLSIFTPESKMLSSLKDENFFKEQFNEKTRLVFL